MATNSSLKVLSNFGRMPFLAKEFSERSGLQVHIELFKDTGSRFDLANVLKLLRKAVKADIIILNGQEFLLYRFCLLKYLFPSKHLFIVSVDLILRVPRSFLQRILSRLKGILLKRVPCFILYHKDVSGYQRHFGIDPNKCIYVPFKVNNIREILEYFEKAFFSSNQTDGSYVMAVGRSLRDYATYGKAMTETRLPGLVLCQDKSILSQNATSYRYESLPSNVRRVPDDGSISLFLETLSRAKMVVIPRFRHDINATGIASYLQAMALKKCVIISHGPGTTDLLLNNEAILVPAEDEGALSAAIQKAWNDRAYRQRIAAAGQEYAFSLGSEDRLLSDIIEVSCLFYLRGKAGQNSFHCVRTKSRSCS